MHWLTAGASTARKATVGSRKRGAPEKETKKYLLELSPTIFSNGKKAVLSILGRGTFFLRFFSYNK